jgi:hypothetical protein
LTRQPRSNGFFVALICGFASADLLLSGSGAHPMGAVGVAGGLGGRCLVQLEAASDVLSVVAFAGLIWTAGAGVVRFSCAVRMPPGKMAGVGRR